MCRHGTSVRSLQGFNALFFLPLLPLTSSAVNATLRRMILSSQVKNVEVDLIATHIRIYEVLCGTRSRGKVSKQG
jgi:hypothetical protein